MRDDIKNIEKYGMEKAVTFFHILISISFFDVLISRKT